MIVLDCVRLFKWLKCPNTFQHHCIWVCACLRKLHIHLNVSDSWTLSKPWRFICQAWFPQYPRRRKMVKSLKDWLMWRKKNNLRSFQRERERDTIANRYKAKQSLHNTQTLVKGDLSTHRVPGIPQHPTNHEISPWKRLLWWPWQWLFGLRESQSSLSRISASYDSALPGRCCYLNIHYTLKRYLITWLEKEQPFRTLQCSSGMTMSHEWVCLER